MILFPTDFLTKILFYRAIYKYNQVHMIIPSYDKT